MKVWIGIVSPNEVVRKFVGKNKVGIVPPDLLKASKFGGRDLKIQVSSFVPEATSPTSDLLEKFVRAKATDLDAIIILYDEVWLGLIENLRSSCFCIPLESAQNEANIQNSIHQSTARALKGWWQVQQRFLGAKDINILSLPLRNFQAKELLKLATVVKVASPELANDLQEGLKELRMRLRPRRRSVRKTLYLVDDAKRFYVYGYERHSRPETGGDHRPSCALNARFRFGCRIDDKRHYNVSESEADRTTISGEFWNCHGVRNHEKRATHLNMFASDMYY